MLPAPFSSIPDSAIVELKFSSGECVFRLRQKTTGFFYLKEGEVHLLRHTKTGDAIPMHRAFSGECFAEASLFSDKYHCDAVVQTGTILAKVDRSQTLMLMHDVSFAAQIGLTHEATYRALSELVKANRLYKTGRGQYELTGPAVE